MPTRRKSKTQRLKRATATRSQRRPQTSKKKTPRTQRRRVTAKRLLVAPPPQPQPQEPPLPSSYGRDLIIAQPRDPSWIHAYWELRPHTLESGKTKLGSQGAEAHLTLRVYELKSDSASQFDVARWFDIGVYHHIGDWTIEVGPPDRPWCVEIGLKARGGFFIALARSNIVRTPPGGPSDRIDEKWGVLSESMPGSWGPSSWMLRANR